MKKCTKCKTLKPKSEFGVDRSRADGLHYTCKACQRAYHLANREVRNARLVQWRKSNPGYLDRNRENISKWSAEHLAERRESRQKRRARESTGTVSSGYFGRLKKHYGEQCMFPGCPDIRVTIDHVVPISKGGAHATENMQLLCRFHNSSKGTATVDYRDGDIFYDMKGVTG